MKKQRLINAEELKSRIGDLHFPNYGMAIMAVCEAPTVDAVAVVRCKDCEWFNKPGCAIYIVDDSDKPKENDFCSFGERRTDV